MPQKPEMLQGKNGTSKEANLSEKPPGAQKKNKDRGDGQANGGPTTKKRGVQTMDEGSGGSECQKTGTKRRESGKTEG